MLVALNLLVFCLLTSTAQDCAQRSDDYYAARTYFTDFQTAKAEQLFLEVVKIEGCEDYVTTRAYQLLAEIKVVQGIPEEARNFALEALRLEPAFEDKLDPLIMQSKGLYGPLREEHFSRLEISSDPPNAIVEIDGKNLGPAPLVVDYIENGEHDLLLHPTDERHGAYSDVVTITQDRVIRAKMPIISVKMSLDSNPQFADVYYKKSEVDSTRVGKTPFEDEFEYGTVKNVVLVKKGYKPARFTLKAETDEIKKNIKLDLVTGKLRLKYFPEDSDVKVNETKSREAHSGILKIELPAGVHKIEVVSKTRRFASRTVKVEIYENREIWKTVNLKHNPYVYSPSITNNASSGCFYLISPEGLGRGWGCNFYYDLLWMDPPGDFDEGPMHYLNENRPIHKIGASIVGAGSSLFQIGQAVDVLFHVEKTESRSWRDEDSTETRYGFESITTAKLTPIQTRSAVLSIQGELDVPIANDAPLPSFSHPLIVMVEESSGATGLTGEYKFDVKGSASLKLRGQQAYALVIAGGAWYGEDLEWDSGVPISSGSFFYGAEVGLGANQTFLIQFMREDFTIKDRAFVASSEMPMRGYLGGSFHFSGLGFFNIGVSVSLASNDPDTAYDPEFGCPKYGLHMGLGYSKGIKRSW
jgi:hypothetical protein